MRVVAGCLVAVSMMAAPAMAAGPDGEFDPCKNRMMRRIAIVFAKTSGLLGRGSECEGKVYPDKKTVCAGDPVRWSVINACDVEVVSEISLVGLDRVAERCTMIRRLELGGVKEIQCRLRRDVGAMKQEYEVRARVGRSKAAVDPELDIRRPN